MASISQATILLSQISPSNSPYSARHLTLGRLCSSFNSLKTTNLLKAPRRIMCQVSTTDHIQPVTPPRNNYYPSLWDWDHMLSLSNGYDEEEYSNEIGELKKQVQHLIKAEQEDPFAKLELIDVIQQLGLYRHFEVEILQALDGIHKRADDYRFSNNLYATALRFRLLRQHGYCVPQDVFKSFMNEAGDFEESLKEDVEGLLSLYEASFLGIKREPIIDKALEFSCAGLKDSEKNKMTERLAVKVDRALCMPLHWRCNRLEARWFMDVYKDEPGMNPTLLKLAKLDYNMVQSVHMKEIGKMARWWIEFGLKKMTFFRDILMENYMFSALMLFEPKYESFRVINAKIATMTVVLDDIYDSCDSLEELEVLTDFINRWDANGIDKLPHTIKTGFTAVYNITNEIGLKMMIERGINVIPYLQKAWADQCNAYLVEAKWRLTGLKPCTLKEYLDIAAVSIGGLSMQNWGFMATAYPLTTETLDSVSTIPRIAFCSSLILRLVNDLATSLFGRNEGDNVKAVECYMNETGESEEAARDHARDLVHDNWKTMNEDVFDHHPLSRAFVNACLDHARGAQYFYQYGNGHDDLREKTRDDLISLFIKPVPMD